MKIISHRGNGNKYKENTQEALLKALEFSYIDGIEFDVRITKDNKAVIIHDPIIDLTSNGSGIVKSMTYKELTKYNFGTKKIPSKICLLDKLLKSIKTNKIILIEIKEELFFSDKKVKIINKILRKYKKLNIYISSFNYQLLKKFNNSNNKCGLLIGYFINLTKINNDFNFNIVEYSYKDKVNNNKETFLFGNIKEDIYKYNIITDKPSFYEKYK